MIKLEDLTDIPEREAIRASLDFVPSCCSPGGAQLIIVKVIPKQKIRK